MRTSPQSSTRYRVALTLLAVVLAYANSLQNSFHFDDFHTVTDNPAVRSLRNIPSFFTDATTFSVLPPNRTYRPFVSTSLAIDYALGHGYVPFWFHFGTLLVFLLQLVVMFWLYRRILRGTSAETRVASAAAVFAVAWYGLHPAMAETVNYVIQRGDIYCTLGVVGSLALFACKPGLRRTGVYLLPFLFGIFSKPPAIVLPALLFAYIAFFEPEPTTGRTRWRYAAFATIPALLAGAAALAVQSAMTPKSFTPTTLSAAAYRLTQPYVLLRSFGTFFLPIHLNVDTDLQPLQTVTPEAIAGLLFVAALLAAIVLTGRRTMLRPISYGLLWFLVASIPTSIYALSEVENDHRMYMPFVGLALAVTWTSALLAQRIVSQRSRQAVLAVGLCLLAVYGYGTHRRNIVWRTDESLWLDDIEKSPHNGRGLMNYGLTQMALGRYPQALDVFTRALEFTPNYPTLEINLGIVYGAMNDAVAAERHFQRAILLAPADDQTHFYYGRWLAQTGRLADALPQLREAVRLNPARVPPRELLSQTVAQLAQQPANPHAELDRWINASLARYQQQDYPGTIAAARQALQLDADSALAWNNIAAAEAALGHWDDAIAAADEALRRQPDFPLAKNNRAWALAAKQKASGR